MRTTKELIEHLSTMPPNTLLWYSFATKEETLDYFVEGCEISDDDFKKVIDTFGGDWDYWQEAVHESVDEKFHCEKCGLFDYHAKELGDQTLCSNCGEEKDLLSA
jgi:hypothetical protein